MIDEIYKEVTKIIDRRKPLIFDKSRIFFVAIQLNLKINDKMASQEQASRQLERLEDIIFDKIRDIKEVINDQDRWVAQEIAMKKQTAGELTYPKYDKKLCYYQEFWKIMISKIKDYSVSNKEISVQIEQLEEAQKQWTHIWAQKSKKKVRRTSDMIEKVFECPFAKCGKNYGSDVSLNLHMKLKHNSGTKTERETLAREICLAEQRGAHISIHLTFPPGYLQKFRQDFNKEEKIDFNKYG